MKLPKRNCPDLRPDASGSQARPLVTENVTRDGDFVETKACITRRLLLGLVTGIALNLGHGAETTLTIEAALEQLPASNPAVGASRLEVERRVAERSAAKSLFGPQIEVSGRYTFIDQSIVIDLDPIRQVVLALHPTVPSAMIPAFVETVQEDRFLRAQLTATWPVYAGGRIQAAQQAAGAAVDEATATARHTANSLFSELVQRYYGAQLARVIRTMRAETLAGLEEHLRQANRLEQEGQIARAERLHAQVARDEAWRELRRTEAAVAIAEAALAGLFGRNDSIAPASPLFLADQPLEPMSAFIAASTARHPALEIMAARRSQAAAGVAAEKGRLRPEVYLFGAKELNRGDTTLLDPDWAAGVGVRLVLFERSDRTHRLTAARLLERRVDRLTEDLQNNLRTLVEKSYREAALAQEQYTSLVSTLELARENLRVREASFREGFGTSLEVVDARLTLLRAESARAVAARDFTVALASLLETSGQPERFLAYAEAATEKISP